MAKKFLTGLNLVVLPSDPISGSEGELYFNSSASVAKIYQAGAWSVLGAGAGGGTTVSTTEPESPEIGDSWYKNDTGEFYVYDGTYWVEVNGVIESNGALTNIDSIVYPDYIVFDTTPETSSASVGTIYWDSGDGIPKAVLSSTTELGIGQEQVALVKNATGSVRIETANQTAVQPTEDAITDQSSEFVVDSNGITSLANPFHVDILLKMTGFSKNFSRFHLQN